MNILNPNTFYKKLITEGDISLYANNEYLDDNGYIKKALDLEIFNKSGEWLENQINYFSTEDDEKETTYGNLSYLGTVLDDTSYVIPQYTEIFKLEVIAFEKEREKVIELFDRYAANLNNHQYSDDDENDILITLGEYSTPVYEEKQDIGGAERFIVSLSILCRVTSGVINSKNVILEVFNEEPLKNEDGSNKLDKDGNAILKGYEKISYIALDIKREADVITDNKSGYEKTYDMNKTDLSLVIGALYINDYLSRRAMSYILDPSEMDIPVKIKYTDKKLEKSKEFKMYITGVNPKIQYGTPISYVISFKLVSE